MDALDTEARVYDCHFLCMTYSAYQRFHRGALLSELYPTPEISVSFSTRAGKPYADSFFSQKIR